MSTRAILAIAVAGVSFAGGYLCSSTFASQNPEISSDSEPPVAPLSPAAKEPDRKPPPESKAPERKEIARPVTLKDKAAQLDGLAEELIAVTADAKADEVDIQIAGAGLMQTLETLKRWEHAQMQRMADAQREKNAGRASARNLSKEWFEAVSQITDPNKREQAIAEIRGALQSNDPTQQLAALNALRRMYDVKFDKTGFRELVLPFTKKGDGNARVAALYALSAVGRRPEDLDLVLALVDSDSPEARTAASHLAVVYSGGDITGRTGDAVLRLFDTKDTNQLTRALNGLWGAKVSPAIAKRMLELADSPDQQMRHDSIYYGLSTLRNKSPEVIRKLVDAIGGSDHSISQRALWGLGHGVPREHGHLVVTAMKKYFEARSSNRSKTRALDAIGRYGTKNDTAWLKGVLHNPEVSERMRKSVERALALIEKR